MKITKYPDNTSYVEIPKEWENTDQYITFRINTYEDVIHLAQLCDVLRYNNVNASITIPCFLDAQADKRFNEFHSSGLKVLTTILNEYENVNFEVFHPHNSEVLEALIPSVKIIDNSEFIFKVLKYLQPDKVCQVYTIEDTYMELNEDFDYSNLLLISSDSGGFKSLIKLCDKINWKGETFSASKARKYKNGKSVLNQLIDKQDFEGKDVLIIDDICVYGGTFKGLSKLLKERNCGKLYLAVSHMTVQNLGEEPVVNYFDKVFTTNSKYEQYTYLEDNTAVACNRNLEIIKLFKNGI